MMAQILLVTIALCAVGRAAPPSPPRVYHQQGSPRQPQIQLQQLNALDYYIDNPDEQSYYYNNQAAQQKQRSVNPNGTPARLESLEPDSEVELIPGAQQPQQPPQQAPVSPNVPGLVPGQRVYIVHMPIPGYRPGTVGGYQPVYVVAAAPSGDVNYAPNGYQNAILLDPSGQSYVSPYLGYPRAAAPQGNPGVLVAGQPPFIRPYDQGYQSLTFGYQPLAGLTTNGVQGADPRAPVRLAQLVSLQPHQPQPPAHPAQQNQQSHGHESAGSSPSPSQIGQSSEISASESKEDEEQQRNARPAPPHALRKPSAV